MNDYGTCLLMTDDPVIHRDVTQSLRPLQIPVRSVESREEALSLALSRSPELILTVVDLHGEPRAGVNLVCELADLNRRDNLTIVALVDKTEERAIEECAELFDEVFQLPVEFPSFTQKMKEFLDLGEEKEGVKQAAPADSALKRAAAAKPEKEEVPVGEDPHDHPLALMFEVQAEILHRLAGTQGLRGYSHGQLLEKLSAVTAEVCAERMRKREE